MNITHSTRTKRGYIMIFTLLIIAAAMVIVAYVGQKGSVNVPFMQMNSAREKAHMLAMSGVEIAISQLSHIPKKENSQPASAEKGGQATDEDQEFLKYILPKLNGWQTLMLTEPIDGIDAQIDVCVMCEEGKININRIYDFEKEQFQGSKEKGWQVVFPEICKNIEKSVKIPELFAVFEKTFKERRTHYNDATELLLKKEFLPFKDYIFYEPSVEQKDKKEKKQQQIYLTDIFTTWSSSGKIEPWLFSSSLMTLLGLSNEESDAKKRGELISESLKKFKKKSNWQQDWQKVLQPLYGKELRSLPKNIDSMLNETFEPHFFSVRVHAKVDEVTQRVYAILERKKSSQASDNITYEVTLKKLYVL